MPHVSKYPDMETVLAILTARPETSTQLLSRKYGIPDSTIRGAWRTRQKKNAEYAEIEKVVDKIRQPAQNNDITWLPETPCLPSPKKEGSFLPEKEGKRIIVIGDMQVKPDIDLSYCSRIGNYVADKRPDIVVNIGDFADMPSLSFHDVPGSMGYEGQRYKRDIEAVHQGMRALMTPIKEAMKTGWNPRLVMCLGNHEDRINRTIKAIPKLDGVMGLPDLEYERWGWEVVPFLKPIIIDGIAYAHYFCSGQMGRPISSARAVLTKMHMSSIAGHMQGRDMAMGKKADGKSMTAIICGSSYEHDENYLNHQTNNHWRGIYVLNDVHEGEFEENAVSMKYLRRRYGEKN